MAAWAYNVAMIPDLLPPRSPKPKKSSEPGATPRLAAAAESPAAAKPENTTETINGVQVQSGDPQFTLTWDTKADLDLHVLEPKGSEIYWQVRQWIGRRFVGC